MRRKMSVYGALPENMSHSTALRRGLRPRTCSSVVRARMTRRRTRMRWASRVSENANSPTRLSDLIERQTGRKCSPKARSDTPSNNCLPLHYGKWIPNLGTVRAAAFAVR